MTNNPDEGQPKGLRSLVRSPQRQRVPEGVREESQAMIEHEPGKAWDTEGRHDVPVTPEPEREFKATPRDESRDVPELDFEPRQSMLAQAQPVVMLNRERFERRARVVDLLMFLLACVAAWRVVVDAYYLGYSASAAAAAGAGGVFDRDANAQHIIIEGVVAFAGVAWLFVRGIISSIRAGKVKA